MLSGAIHFRGRKVCRGKPGTECMEGPSGLSFSPTTPGEEEAQQLPHQFHITLLQGSKHIPSQSIGKLFHKSLAKAWGPGGGPKGVLSIEVGSQGHAQELSLVSEVCSPSTPGLQDLPVLPYHLGYSYTHFSCTPGPL